MKNPFAVFLLFASMACLADIDDGAAFVRKGSYNNAAREFREAAEKGDPVAARLLGLMLERGITVSAGTSFPAAPAEAAVWYAKAAEKGDKEGAAALGALYASGHGVQRDARKSLEWFRQSGRDVDAITAPKPDMTDVQLAEYRAWVTALRYYFNREFRYPRQSVQSNQFGTVDLVFDPVTRTVAARDDNTGRALVNAAEVGGRKALALAPPSQVVKDFGVKFSMLFDFAIKRD